MPEQFSSTGRGTHSEGFVVKFIPTRGDAWVGNFQGGFGKCHGVFLHPDRKNLVVVANGQAYVVDPETRSLVAEFGADLVEAFEVPEIDLLVFTNGVHFEAIGPTGLAWRSERVSWDGVRSLARAGVTLKGEAISPIDDSWHPFTLNLRDGTHTGGSWDESQFHAI
jgi:hypothetical protein